jgi:hypothetical protein
MPLPVDDQTEDCVISLCVLDGAEILALCAAAGITAESFSVIGRRLVFSAVQRLVLAGVPVDQGVVAAELRDRGEMEQVGGVPRLVEMTSLVPTTAQAGFYVGKLRVLSLRRRLMQEALTAAAAARDFAGEAGEVDEFCAQQEERFMAVTRARIGAGASRGGALPRLMAWGDLVGKTQRVEPAQLVAGMIHRGGKVMLGGGSKSFKTWVLIDLALSVATGTPWWGMRTTKGRVLFVNFELQTWSFESRVRSIATAKRVEVAENFTSWHLRGYSRDLAELIPQFLSAVVGSKFDMIILDPIYKCLGERDENANGEVAALLNEVEALAVRSEAAVVFGHHFSKGNQAAKDARDRVSGAGAWTRDPDTVITLTPHEEEDCFTVECVLRDLKPRSPLTVRWAHPCMEVAEGLDPAALRQPGRPKESSVGDVVKILGPDMLTHSQWCRMAERSGMSESTFKRRKADAIRDGRVEQNGPLFFVKKEANP